MNNITKVLLENEALIYKIINKYRTYFDIEDLYQVAAIGLIEAYNNYRDGYNAKFTSYAYPYILGEVIKYIQSFKTVKVNRKSQIIYLKILKAKELLAQQLMKVPTNHELSLYLEIDETVINEVILANTTVESLDQIVDADNSTLKLYDRLGYYDTSIENYSLSSELAKLPPDEKELIEARFYEDMSQREIGKKLGMYQVEVSRKEKKILKKLYDNINA